MHSTRFYILSVMLVFLAISIKAQEFEPAKDFGSEFGITGMFGKEGIDGNSSPFWGISGAYFYDLRNGVRVGINRYYNYSGAQYGYLLPIYYAYRTRSSRSNAPFEYETFGEFMLQLFTHLIPGRAEFNVGPVLGYFKTSNQPITDGYKLNNQAYLAANAKIRLTFQIWRFNLGGNFGASYIPSKNFYLVSPDPMLNGNRTSWSLEVGAILTFSFD
ncbi:MAG: hypothetical protein AB1777_08100 [Bacteroidota bacterium]